jgi:uncharacterized membrane protein
MLLPTMNYDNSGGPMDNAMSFQQVSYMGFVTQGSSVPYPTWKFVAFSPSATMTLNNDNSSATLNVIGIIAAIIAIIVMLASVYRLLVPGKFVGASPLVKETQMLPVGAPKSEERA